MPVTGVTLNSVSYVVTGTPLIPGSALPAGSVPTPGTDESFTFGLPVPVGQGYTLSVSAASAEAGDDITCTGAMGPFDIAPNTGVSITLTLTCRDNSTGQLIANTQVETDACPRLIPDYALVIPSYMATGSHGAVAAAGHDLDGKAVSYRWSVHPARASVGSFSNPAVARTSFQCSGIGSLPLTVTMSNQECQKRLDVEVTCSSGGECGDGIFQVGEDCDPYIPAGQPGSGQFGCTADCNIACGDGVIESPVEECELNGGPPHNCMHGAVPLSPSHMRRRFHSVSRAM